MTPPDLDTLDRLLAAAAEASAAEDAFTTRDPDRPDSSSWPGPGHPRYAAWRAALDAALAADRALSAASKAALPGLIAAARERNALRETVEAYREVEALTGDAAHVDALNRALHKEADRAAALTVECDRLRGERDALQAVVDGDRPPYVG